MDASVRMLGHNSDAQVATAIAAPAAFGRLGTVRGRRRRKVVRATQRRAETGSSGARLWSVGSA
jgi:hypothetical protein